MIIKNNGFYDLSSIEESQIIIDKNLSVNIFDDGQFPKNIYLRDNSRLNFFSYIKNTNSNFLFHQEEKNTSLFLNTLVYPGRGEEFNLNQEIEIKNNNNDAYVKILSFIPDASKISVDGIIKVSDGIKKINCHLKEENIYLGETGKVIASPKLLIESNDIEASHSCKVERLKMENLFYLQSRGLNYSNATKLIITSKVDSTFKGLSKIDNGFYINLIEKIFKKKDNF